MNCGTYGFPRISAAECNSFTHILPSGSSKLFSNFAIFLPSLSKKEKDKPPCLLLPLFLWVGLLIGPVIFPVQGQRVHKRDRPADCGVDVALTRTHEDHRRLAPERGNREHPPTIPVAHSVVVPIFAHFCSCSLRE